LGDQKQNLMLAQQVEAHPAELAQYQNKPRALGFAALTANRRNAQPVAPAVGGGFGCGATAAPLRTDSQPDLRCRASAQESIGSTLGLT
jgi:hypothetical protein